MARYPWPGNVRELRNAIERALILGDGEWIEVDDLPVPAGGAEGRRESASASGGAGTGQGAGAGPAAPGGTSFRLPAEGVDFDALERDLVKQALESAGGNQTQAARLLKMTRDQIRYRIEKFGLG